MNVISLREEKMTQMLSEQLMSYEHTWIKYDLEESEVNLHISNILYNELIEELVGEIEFLQL